MTVSVVYQGKKHVVAVGKSPLVKDILQKMNINPDIVLVAKNGEIVLETEKIAETDKIEIIRTISGG